MTDQRGPNVPNRAVRPHRIVQSVSASTTDPDRGNAVLNIETLTTDDAVRKIFEVRILLFSR